MKTTKPKGSDYWIAIAHLTAAKNALQNPSKKSKPANLKMAALVEIQALENVISYLETLARKTK